MPQTPNILRTSETDKKHIDKKISESNKCQENPPSTPYNSCGKCTNKEENNLSPNYYAYSDFRALNCFRSSTKNCFILNFKTTISPSDTNECLICMSGYFLNIDKVCETLLPPNRKVTAKFSIASITASIKKQRKLQVSILFLFEFIICFLILEFNMEFRSAN